MYRRWYHSRLFWIGFCGFVGGLWVWLSPIIAGEGRYFGARWIAPGNFYQGFGVTQNIHSLEIWMGRPYAGFANLGRQTGITNVSFPFESRRHSWSANEQGPFWFQWGNPSADSFTIAIDYWFLAPSYLITWISTVILWQRRKHRFAPHCNPESKKPNNVDIATPSKLGRLHG